VTIETNKVSWHRGGGSVSRKSTEGKNWWECPAIRKTSEKCIHQDKGKSSFEHRERKAWESFLPSVQKKNVSQASAEKSSFTPVPARDEMGAVVAVVKKCSPGIRPAKTAHRKGLVQVVAQRQKPSAGILPLRLE